MCFGQINRLPIIDAGRWPRRSTKYVGLEVVGDMIGRMDGEGWPGSVGRAGVGILSVHLLTWDILIGILTLVGVERTLVPFVAPIVGRGLLWISEIRMPRRSLNPHLISGMLVGWCIKDGIDGPLDVVSICLVKTGSVAGRMKGISSTDS